MLKRFVLISELLTALASPWAQSHPFETLRGLERFSKSPPTPLSSHNIKPTADTVLAIKDVKIGDNILPQAINLAEQGGQLGRIRGGTRSHKIKFSFEQPYADTRLEQKLELYFDKHNGHIQQVTATYSLQDAYKNITPILQQTLSAAVAKFGSPLTMQQVHDVSGQQDAEVKLQSFIKGLQDQLHPLGLEYFLKRNISRSTKWVKGEQDYALLHSGFDRCYLWQTHEFSQILTLCFFDKTGANRNLRGVELDLHNFPLSQQIKDLGNPHRKPDISL